jgi:hypothetical protein
MNRKFLTALMAGILGIVASFAAPAASADDPRFSLSSGFDNSSDKYETGPWMFKLTAPAGLHVAENADPDMVHFGADNSAGNTQLHIGDTEAAASYNLYTGSATSPEINLTGKVKVYSADKNSVFGLSQNDYAAQMDVYQNLDKFTAKGTLGSKVLGSQTGLILSPLLYGSFGGIYQFTEKTSTGIDMSLSQESPATGVMQHEFSAFVNYRLDDHFKARGYVLRGISNGAANNAVGGQVYYGF